MSQEISDTIIESALNEMQLLNEMKNIEQILREFQRRGFRIEYGKGSLVKLYPPDRNMPFYSLHIGERAIHPLKRFAKQHWNLDLSTF